MGFFVTKMTELGSDPSLTALIRVCIAAAVLGVLCFVKGGKEQFKVTRSGLLVSALAGLVGVAIFNMCYIHAALDIGVAGAGVLLYTSPMFTCLLSMMVFKERITPVKLLAIALNMCGCFLAVTNGVLDFHGFTLFGVMAGVGAGFSYACMTIFSKMAADRGVKPTTLAFYSFVTAALILAFISRPWEELPEVFSGRLMLYGFLLGTISTAVAYIVYMTGVSKAKSVSKVPVIASIEAVVASCVGFICLGESFGMVKLVGIILVLMSIVITNMENILNERIEKK